MACQHALLAGSVKSGQFLVRTLVDKLQASSGFTTAVASMLTAISEPALWRSTAEGCCEFAKSGQFLVRTLVRQTASQ